MAEVKAVSRKAYGIPVMLFLAAAVIFYTANLRGSEGNSHLKKNLTELPLNVNAGEDKPLVWVADGTYHVFHANHPWILIYNGNHEKRMEAGSSWWKGAGPGGFIGAKGIQNGTVIESRKIS